MTRPEISPADQDGFWFVAATVDMTRPELHLVIPRGMITDFASVPPPVKWFPDFNVDGRSRWAALMHDTLYAAKETSRAFADEMLRRVLIDTGVHPLIARMYWLGVRLGGGKYWRAGRSMDEKDFATEHDWAAYKKHGAKVVQWHDPSIVQ